MKNKILLAATVMAMGLVSLWFLGHNLLPKIPSPTVVPLTLISPSQNDISDFIRLEMPTEGQLIKSPLTVTGQAVGYWFFEASFPVKIYDAHNIELGVVPAQAQGEWMTEDFLPFKAVLTFKKPTTSGGYLVLQKDNPSGLSQYDNELRVPIKFDLENWTEGTPTSIKCKVGGCSSQLCVDESEGEVITTCEYKDEYACYKNAKCERQEDGKCGWTPTEELVACLYSAIGAPVD